MYRVEKCAALIRNGGSDRTISMSGMSKQWDVFISHASEDKEAVVLPLAAALVDAGVKVWLDRQQLRIGDSIRASIDEGLARSRFGVVVISEAFLAKRWPALELNALMALEENIMKEHSSGLAPCDSVAGRGYIADALRSTCRRHPARCCVRRVGDREHGFRSKERKSVEFGSISGASIQRAPPYVTIRDGDRAVPRGPPAIFLQLHAVRDVDIQLGGDARAST